MNPAVVARHVHSASLVMLVWIAGGAIALLGAGIFAELAARRPQDGGLYAYMRDAFHPALAFVFGWTLLLVSQSGGMAAAAVTFATYFEPLTGWREPPAIVGILAIAFFTAINALGVRTGATTQNAFMVLKILAIAAFAAVGLFSGHTASAGLPLSPPGGAIGAVGLAMVPILFAYSGWQTSSFMTAELKDPAKMLPRGLIAGVLAVVLLYVAVNAACLRVLGIAGLAATNTPASQIAQIAFGQVGLRVMATVIALSTLGFSEQPDSHVAARLLSDGGGWNVFQAACVGEPANPRSGGRNRAAGADRNRHRAIRALRSDSQLRHVQRLHLLRIGGDRAHRLPQPRRARSAAPFGRSFACPDIPSRHWSSLPPPGISWATRS